MGARACKFEDTVHRGHPAAQVAQALMPVRRRFLGVEAMPVVADLEDGPAARVAAQLHDDPGRMGMTPDVGQRLPRHLDNVAGAARQLRGDADVEVERYLELGCLLELVH